MMESGNQFQVFDECDEEVAMCLRKRTLADICLCKKYGQSRTVARRCPVCQEIIPTGRFRHRNRPHVPTDHNTGHHPAMGAAKAASPTYHHHDHTHPELEQLAEEQILEFAEDTKAHSHICSKPRLISAYDFIDRYYLPRLLENDHVDKPLVPESLEKYFYLPRILEEQFVEEPLVPESLEKYFVDEADPLAESVGRLNI